ncbi:energy transducer TonB [uncultured Paludibaculum sp.]|uniref:energy transducer TonB n=1 Tax=uncultured Paludibaculum sp. TaxID=1765020 RepID=UPI002AAAB57C|nr:energy transducer TonB [uncultured Paludibaculum sp.]
MLPPLAVTSRPVEVADLYSRDPYRGSSQLVSIALHAGVVALLFTLGTTPQVQQAVKSMVPLVEPYWPPHLMPRTPQRDTLAGGGGGANETLPASRGRLARASTRQFVPPSVDINNPAPRLIMEATIVAPPDAQLPKVDLPNFGDPFSKATIPSNGRGKNGGIGDGDRGGVGPGIGPGYGPGNDAFGSVGYAGRGGVTAPVPIFRVEPEYSEEARKAKFQGAVRLAIIVDEAGHIAAVKVIGPLGMGLDEKAVEAVHKWRFKPGTKNGRPVPVEAQVLVSFHLL